MIKLRNQICKIAAALALSITVAGTSIPAMAATVQNDTGKATESLSAEEISLHVSNVSASTAAVSAKSGAAKAPSGIKGNGTGGIYIDINTAPYTSFARIPTWGAYAYGNSGCAWFASSRVKQLTGKGSTIWSGTSWYNREYKNYGFSRGSVLKAPALACYGHHVAVVEKIEGNVIYVSQGGLMKSWNGSLGSQGSDAAHGGCVISKMTEKELKNLSNCGGFIGYVYLPKAAAAVSTQVSAEVAASGEAVTQTADEATGSAGTGVEATGAVITAIANSTNGVSLKWSADAEASKYQVYRKGVDTTWGLLGETTSTSFLDKTAKNGKLYRYVIKSVDAKGALTSSYDKTGKRIYRVTAPVVKSVTNNTSDITVTWTKVAGASGYKVWRKKNGGEMTLVATVKGADKVSFKDTKVSTGNQYRYLVRAFIGGSLSDSVTKNVNTTYRLGRPTVSWISLPGGKKIKMTWKKVARADGYQIKYVNGKSSKTKTIKGGSATAGTISGLKKGKTYTLYLRSYKVVNGQKVYSAWSKKHTMKVNR